MSDVSFSGNCSDVMLLSGRSRLVSLPMTDTRLLCHRTIHRLSERLGLPELWTLL